MGEAAEQEQPERQSLGVLGGRRPAAASGRAGGLLGGAAGFKRKAAPAGGDPENGNTGGSGGLDIFVDDEFAGGAPAASAPAAFLQPGRCARGLVVGMQSSLHGAACAGAPFALHNCARHPFAHPTGPGPLPPAPGPS